MIQIESVTIREMRGIRELTIQPNGKNFLVSGPNGSGKSGVVDAIQFALTGEMSRLSGKGTGGLSVSRHGPHVDRRDAAGSSQVSLRLTVPETGRSAVLTRIVKSVKTFRLEPNDPDIRAVIHELARHPELILSRREIIKYIIVESGQRSKEIQALLKLEELGNTRGVLKTVSNRLSIAYRKVQGAVEGADDALRRHLDLTSLSGEAILTAVNPHRHVLGLVELDEFTEDTNLSAGVLEGGRQQAFNKISALRDLEVLEEALSGLPTLGGEVAERIVSDVTTLEEDRELLEAIARRSFLERGLEFVEGTYCPLCDTEWEEEEALRSHLEGKLARANEAGRVQKRLLHDASVIANQADRIVGLLQAVHPIAKTDGPEGFFEQLENWMEDLRGFGANLDTVEKIRIQRDRLGHDWAAPPPLLRECLGAMKQTVQGKADESTAIAAQTFLSLAQDRLETSRRALRDAKRSARAAEVGRTLYRTYCDVVDGYLSALYAEVEDEFGAYYREINADDEGEFKAKLEPAEAGLGLEVAFYDKGMFPPGAYHSEGHQDGMGVCLYLALLNRLLGSRFNFAVLDDVVMSVDQAHRKEFCRLLKTRFPATQFIITTHDRVWAKQMQTEGLVESKGGVAFHSWSVQTGPIVEEAADVWDRIEADVEKGEIDVAAGRLRRHMEYVSGELADGLGAKPRYRGDFAHDLGDLLSAVIGRHGELLKRAATAAKNWKNEDAQVAVEALKQARAEAVARYGGEVWVVNKAVHWNEWANLSKAEFQDVVKAFRSLLEQLECTNEECHSRLYVTPRKGEEETLRCLCGSVSVNLRMK